MADEQIPAVAESCKTCRFWHKHEPQFVYGDCRRLPPQFTFQASFWEKGDYGERRKIVEISRERHGVFPNVYEDEWCGEWQTKVQQPPCLYCGDTGLSVRYDENRAVWADQPCPMGCPRRG